MLMTTYGVTMCSAHLHAGSEVVRGTRFHLHRCAACLYFHVTKFPSSFLFPKRGTPPPYFLRSTAMKSDTSARLGGRWLLGGGGGGLKRRLQRVSVGALWEYSLMRPFASLETTCTGAKQHTLWTPASLSKALIPHPGQSCLFSHLSLAAVTHKLKGWGYWVEAFSLRV